ncbi:PEP-CTERM sorting domain-containing protein [Lacipirellula parvula]|uniref:Ice-binding protein C-terminal domain-containing protein n=1 Tax=Lacipirellula parvula TaxID=2650471 RepID=A0A5K7XKH3_9BACT|nr:PEP-CTERM sorting domain-containing protein [Lacipirellula parvula]BBO34783.1 hypothetical protein PLANPX_4395 [Lacipirellula parvula]
MSRVSIFESVRSFALLLAAAAVISVGLGAGEARAVVPTPTGFTLNVSPYARVLDYLGTPQFMDVLWEESCDNPHLRVRARNKPAIMLSNNADSAAPITSFTLSMDSSQPYFFGTGDAGTDNFTAYIKDTIYTDAGVSITGSSISPDGKTLTVNFDGLTAGKKAIFNVDFDAEDPGMFPFPDYRMALLGAPYPGENPTTPATYGATFTNAASPVPNAQTLSASFTQMIETPTYHDLVIRPYGVMDKVEIIPGGGGEVPEPSSLVLALGGLGLLAVRRIRATA